MPPDPLGCSPHHQVDSLTTLIDGEAREFVERNRRHGRSRTTAGEPRELAVQFR